MTDQKQRSEIPKWEILRDPDIDGERVRQTLTKFSLCKSNDVKFDDEN